MKNLQLKSINGSEKFIHDIEKLVIELKLDYIDAVIYYCEKNGIEVETAAAIIKSSSKVKAKIQLEAEDINYLPKTSKLPI